MNLNNNSSVRTNSVEFKFYERNAKQLLEQVIQKVREELEQAKNAGKLDTQDTSAYMILYDEWKDAKGNQKVKKKIKCIKRDI